MKQGDSASGAAPKPGKNRPDPARKSLEQINAELSAQNLKLRARAERRSASLAHLAHELRTPLTSILGFAEILLSQEQLTDAQRNFCERIQNSAHQLQSSLNQLAELSRLEIGPDDPTSSD